MGSTKHTPGPWKVSDTAMWYEYGRVEGADIVHALEVDEEGDPKVILWACSCCDGVNIPNEADARLIAAAPELLEACEFALRGITQAGHGASDAACDLRAAIAKAKGEG